MALLGWPTLGGLLHRYVLFTCIIHLKKTQLKMLHEKRLSWKFCMRKDILISWFIEAGPKFMHGLVSCPKS